ncbi:hypothetical protein OPT61_g564 [Boeremia exigua]|uniref:Uncharacterized protein n=1 Tax=Boeremia exigua TaxID=749465 RepID=A0ACC2ITH1_9PLEO|nr:hypothetical protein OPT61_g564 [Boeremia exigua]
MRFQSLFLVVSLSRCAISADPGLPMDDPTVSFWQLPPNPDTADRQSKHLPSDVDVVIIGSGITGTGVARWLLRDGSQERPLRIAMVEARQACSGATGRNAGHIRPLPWDYVVDKSIIGAADAARIARLKARHYSEYAKAAEEDLDAAGRDSAEVRAMDSIDAWFTEDSFNEIAQKLEVVKQELPDIGKEWTIISGAEAKEKTLMPGVVGIAVQSTKSGGAMWPYRFVTQMQAALLKKYPSFSLDTHTPVLNITSNAASGRSRYEVETSRGVIQTRHVIHAAGAWTPHLLGSLEKQITQARWHMGAVAAGDKIPDAGHWPALSENNSQPGGREYGLWRDHYGTLTQLPKSGLFIVGGGVAGEGEEVPPWDDHTPVEPVIASYLNGMMPTFFGYDNWGAERPATPQKYIHPGRTKALWTGVDAISWDSYPLVGALPTNVTGREIKEGTEWICGAYSGDGMPSAWMAAKGLSTAILSAEHGKANQTWPKWFPDAWKVSTERLRKPCRNSTENQCQ